MSILSFTGLIFRDLNKELDKMKGMLSDIVDKVNSSLAVNPTDDAESGDQNELKNSDRSSVISL